MGTDHVSVVYQHKLGRPFMDGNSDEIEEWLIEQPHIVGLMVFVRKSQSFYTALEWLRQRNTKIEDHPKYQEALKIAKSTMFYEGNEQAANDIAREIIGLFKI